MPKYARATNEERRKWLADHDEYYPSHPMEQNYQAARMANDLNKEVFDNGIHFTPNTPKESILSKVIWTIVLLIVSLCLGPQLLTLLFGNP